MPKCEKFVKATRGMPTEDHPHDAGRRTARCDATRCERERVGVGDV